MTSSAPRQRSSTSSGAATNSTSSAGAPGPVGPGAGLSARLWSSLRSRTAMETANDESGAITG